MKILSIINVSSTKYNYLKIWFDWDLLLIEKLWERRK
jgi:hypothetical protein